MILVHYIALDFFFLWPIFFSLVCYGGTVGQTTNYSPVFNTSQDHHGQSEVHHIVFNPSQVDSQPDHTQSGSSHTGQSSAETTDPCDHERTTASDCERFRECCESHCEDIGKSFQVTCNIGSHNARQHSCSCKETSGHGDSDDHGNGADSHGSPPHQPGRPPARPSHPASGSNKKCGIQAIQSQGRIIGGGPVEPHSWPWQISLEFRGRHICGGSLISDLHVITAAHCVIKNRLTSNYRIVLGMHDRELEDGITAGVSEIYVHPEYNQRDHSFDAAIVELAKPVSFSDHISPICLPQRLVTDGSSCKATGWGDTQGTGDNTYLLEVDIPIVSHRICNAKFHDRITETMICAGADGKNSCYGDSGGPLACQGSDRAWELQGITSFGAEDCVEEDMPGVYTKVMAVKSWVQTVMNS